MKKKRLISLIAAFSLVFTGVTAYVPSGVYAEEQTAQWIQIDRGEDAEEEDISSIKLWYNVKVWPMEYEIYTADESTLTEGFTEETHY